MAPAAFTRNEWLKQQGNFRDYWSTLTEGLEGIPGIEVRYAKSGYLGVRYQNHGLSNTHGLGSGSRAPKNTISFGREQNIAGRSFISVIDKWIIEAQQKHGGEITEDRVSRYLRWRLDDKTRPAAEALVLIVKDLVRKLA